MRRVDLGQAPPAAPNTRMLRGSVWMCGLPAACTSPCEPVEHGRHLELARSRRYRGDCQLPQLRPDCPTAAAARSQPDFELGVGAYQRCGVARARSDQGRTASLVQDRLQAVGGTATSGSAPPSACASTHSGSQASTRSLARWLGRPRRAAAPLQSQGLESDRHRHAPRASVAVRAIARQTHLVLNKTTGGQPAPTRARRRQNCSRRRETRWAMVEHRALFLRGRQPSAPSKRDRPTRRGRPFDCAGQPPAQHELVHAPAGTSPTAAPRRGCRRSRRHPRRR